MLVAYVVLMLYYEYIIVIYDGIYVRNMVMRGLGDRYNSSMEENGTYSVTGVLLDYS